MTRIGLCWELGAGVGHLKQLAEYAKVLNSLPDQKYNISLVVRDSSLIDLFPEFSNYQIIPAPISHTTNQSINVINYLGLMTVNGYQTQDGLQPHFIKWIAVLERTLFAYPVGSQGLAFAGTPNVSKVDLPRMIETSKRSTPIWQNAERFAQEMTCGSKQNSLSAMLKERLQNLKLL